MRKSKTIANGQGAQHTNSAQTSMEASVGTSEQMSDIAMTSEMPTDLQHVLDTIRVPGETQQQKQIFNELMAVFDDGISPESINAFYQKTEELKQNYQFNLLKLKNLSVVAKHIINSDVWFALVKNDFYSYTKNKLKELVGDTFAPLIDYCLDENWFANKTTVRSCTKHIKTTQDMQSYFKELAKHENANDVMALHTQAFHITHNSYVHRSINLSTEEQPSSMEALRTMTLAASEDLADDMELDQQSSDAIQFSQCNNAQDFIALAKQIRGVEKPRAFQKAWLQLYVLLLKEQIKAKDFPTLCADVPSQQMCPLCYSGLTIEGQHSLAVGNHNINTAQKLLVLYGADVNKYLDEHDSVIPNIGRRYTAIQLAFFSGDLNIFYAMMQQPKSNINLPVKVKRIPARIYCSTHTNTYENNDYSEEIDVPFLHMALESLPLISFKTKGEISPSNKNDELFGDIIKKSKLWFGANLNVSDTDGNTLLHKALLLEISALQSSQQFKPLYITIKKLIKYGADLFCKNKQGLSPIDLILLLLEQMQPIMRKTGQCSAEQLRFYSFLVDTAHKALLQQECEARKADSSMTLSSDTSSDMQSTSGPEPEQEHIDAEQKQDEVGINELSPSMSKYGPRG